MSRRESDDATIASTSKKLKGKTNVGLEDVIKYYLMPSLQHVSVSNLIITLWKQADIKYQIVKLFNENESVSDYFDICELTLKIDDKVLAKLSQLAVPSSIRKTLSNIVRPIGKEIFEWIFYQDKYIFKVDESYPVTKSIAVNYIDHLVWTARGRIDYGQTAKVILAKEEMLPDNYKYNIACEYCFEDIVATIAPKVINTTLLTLTHLQRQPMIHFWTAHITGDFEYLDREVDTQNRYAGTNYSINECLFQVILSSRTNQVAVKYIWDKLNNEEKSRQIVSAIQISFDTDIRCFLLSQIRKEQEKQVFEDYADSILLDFLDNWLWGQYFSTTLHHVLDIISECAYLNLLDGIADTMNNYVGKDTEKYNQIKCKFMESWQYSPERLKDYVMKHPRDFENLFFNLLHKENIDIIQSVLSYANDAQKKRLIISDEGVRQSCNLITTNQWDLLDMLFGSSLFSRKIVKCLKRRLVTRSGKDIAIHFIRNKEWNNVEKFLQWVFNSDDDRRVFKLTLADSEICANILKSIVTWDKADFTELEFFFDWCASGNVESIVALKTEVPIICFKNVICTLITEDKYELLDQFLNWCFINDQEKIAQFKQYFYQDDIIQSTIDLIINLIEQDNNQLQSFKKFVNYLCPTEEGRNNLISCLRSCETYRRYMQGIDMEGFV